MPVVFTLELPGVTSEQLDAVNAALFEALDGPPQGLIAHVETPSADGFTVIDIWDSAEDFDRFAPDALMPALSANGVAMPAPPEFRTVHTLFGSGIDDADYRALAEGFYDAFTRNDPGVADMFTEDFVEHEEVPGIPPTREGVVQWLAMMHAAFEDLTFTPLDIVGLHGKGACHLRMSGRHVGEFAGIAPTGRSFSIEGIDYVVLTPDGRCREHWGFTDQAGMMAQLGVGIPQQAGATATQADVRT